jgi:hypothetical protein
MRILRHLFAAALAALLASLPLAASRAVDTAEEYEIKAVYLFNLGGFVEWPAEAKREQFTICIFGVDPFGGILDFLIEKRKTIQDQPVAAKRLAQVEDVDACHILYISSSEELRVQEITRRIQGKAILTVGETERFLNQGGMIQFYQRDGKVRLALDPESLGEAKLKPSSHLMRISQSSAQ